MVIIDSHWYRRIGIVLMESLISPTWNYQVEFASRNWTGAFKEWPRWSGMTEASNKAHIAALQNVSFSFDVASPENKTKIDFHVSNLSAQPIRLAARVGLYTD